MPRKRFRSEEDVRRALAAKIGREPEEAVWNYLLNKGYVQEVLDGYSGAFSQLVKEYTELKNLVSSGSQEGTKNTERVHEAPPDRRGLALSRIWAAEASRLPEVVKFREEVLGGKLISREEIPAWIEKARKEDGGATLWLKIPFQGKIERDAKGRPRWFDALASLSEEERNRLLVGFSLETLSYPSPEDNWARAVPINTRGVLGRLKRLAEYLISNYPWWQEAQAVAFVLSGVVPLVPRARYSFSFGPPRPSILTLKVDVLTPPDEAAKLYAKGRRMVFKGNYKPLTEKHLELAVFAAENPGLSWAALMNRWNEQHPEWAYSDRRLFARDAKAAYARVTGQSFSIRPLFAQ